MADCLANNSSQISLRPGPARPVPGSRGRRRVAEASGQTVFPPPRHTRPDICKYGLYEYPRKGQHFPLGSIVVQYGVVVRTCLATRLYTYHLGSGCVESCNHFIVHQSASMDFRVPTLLFLAQDTPTSRRKVRASRPQPLLQGGGPG